MRRSSLLNHSSLIVELPFHQRLRPPPLLLVSPLHILVDLLQHLPLHPLLCPLPHIGPDYLHLLRYLLISIAAVWNPINVVLLSDFRLLIRECRPVILEFTLLTVIGHVVSRRTLIFVLPTPVIVLFLIGAAIYRIQI